MTSTSKITAAAKKFGAVILYALRFLVILPLLPFNGEVEESMGGPLAGRQYGIYFEKGDGLKLAFGKTTFILHSPGKRGRR